MSNVLVQFSDALAEIAAGARAFTAEIADPEGRRVSGILWNAGTVVASEQILPEAAEYQVRVGDRTTKAHLVGRDEGTNVAVLKLAGEISGTLPDATAPKLGALAIVLGAGAESVTARLAMVRALSGEWQSLAGGTVDHRIVLDARLGADEGGPVLSADGKLLGMSTRGARRQSLVIPTATIARVATVLLEKGRIERGWLGVAVRPVMLPEALRPAPEQRVGLMVMDVSADGPCARAGVLPGDVLLAVGGKPTTRLRDLARQLGPQSIGQSLAINLARAGAVIAASAVIEARKPA